MKKENKYVDDNLIYIFENTTPYQRLLWLKKAIEFAKRFNGQKQWSTWRKSQRPPGLLLK